MSCPIKDIHNKYSDAIKRAKTQHWQDFLEVAQGPDIWVVNQYISNPSGDGGQQCIPRLKVPQADGSTAEVTTNEEKVAAFHRSFFPPKPAVTSLPNDPDYPARVKYKFWLLETQLSQQISRLQPYKAPGEDGIPNVVLKQTAKLIIPYLIQIFRAVFKLGTYSDSWHLWNTIVLRKPGKPRYDTPKAHRPIALMNTIGQLLSAIIAEDITYMCERSGLLPDTHFGGRPGKNTSDVMHFLTNKIKGTWR